MTVSFHTLGCKTNAYETQAMLEQFRKAGFETADFSDSCDVYVINTCAVTAEASRKSRQIAGRCKKINPDSLVVLTGCYVQEAGAALADKTGADIVVGNGEKSKIVSLVTDALQDRESLCESAVVLIDDRARMEEYEEQSVTGQEGRIRAYVKIQDGCNRFCSYCIIPYLRGRSRSRDFDHIIQEVRFLSASGFPEIVLTGIDISSYRMNENTDSEDSLVRLIAAISGIEGVKRIRLGSLETGIVSERLVKSLKEIPGFCPHFHLSLQSGCDSVLKRMNRHYTTADFEAAVKAIRSCFPQAAITTDIIAGFAGETQEEFEATVDFVRRIGFSRLHVFPYSRRRGTMADRMPDQLSRAEKERRTKILIQTGAELQRGYESAFLGRECSVLIEEAAYTDTEKDRERRLRLEGYTPEYVRVRIERKLPADRFCSDPDLQVQPGQIVRAVPDTFSADGILLAAAERG